MTLSSLFVSVKNCFLRCWRSLYPQFSSPSLSQSDRNSFEAFVRERTVGSFNESAEASVSRWMVWYNQAVKVVSFEGVNKRRRIAKAFDSQVIRMPIISPSSPNVCPKKYDAAVKKYSEGRK